LSLDLITASEPLSTVQLFREFQTVGAVQRKADISFVNHCVRVGVTKLVEDLECWRQMFDRLNDTLEDLDAVVSQSETDVSDISQSSTVTESQRLQRLHVRATCCLNFLR